MKVICDRAALLEGINLVSGVAATRTARPQLSCVKFTATRGKDAGLLTLAATDAEISINMTIGQVDVEGEGSALLPADKIRQIVSAQEQEPTLTIEREDDHCHIRGSDAHFKVFGYPPEDFPPVADFDIAVEGSANIAKAKSVFEISAGALRRLIARTIFATARENSRYAINGVLLKRDGKKLEMVATDGRRLALSRGTAKGGSGDAASCIVPTKALALVQKLADDPEDLVRVAIADTQIYFAFGASGGPVRAVISSNLVEGTFPPYEDVIPKDQDKAVTIDRDVLASAVRRAALLTNEESRGVRLAFNAAKKHLHLSSRAPEMGEAEVTVDVADYKGDDIEIGFNPGFLTEALRIIEDPAVVIEMKAGNKPGLIKSGSDFTYVVMPVSLS